MQKHLPGLELFGAERMRNILNRITQTVSIVISWINTPEKVKAVHKSRERDVNKHGGGVGVKQTRCFLCGGVA